MNMKYWNIDLTSDAQVMNMMLTRVPGATAEDAQVYALGLMKRPSEWRVVGIDRA